MEVEVVVTNDEESVAMMAEDGVAEEVAVSDCMKMDRSVWL